MQFAYYKEDGVPVEIVSRSRGKLLVSHPDEGALIDDIDKFELIKEKENDESNQTTS